MRTIYWLVIAFFCMVSLHAATCSYCGGKGFVWVNDGDGIAYQSGPDKKKVKCPDCNGNRRDDTKNIRWDQLPMPWEQSIQDVNNKYRWTRRSNTLQVAFRLEGRFKFNAIYIFENNKLTRLTLSREIPEELYGLENPRMVFDFLAQRYGTTSPQAGSWNEDYAAWHDEKIKAGKQTPIMSLKLRGDNGRKLRSDIKCWTDPKKKITTVQLTIGLDSPESPDLPPAAPIKFLN